MFFSSPRWKILEIIAKKPSSPIEIADEMGTSVSYISQQLKLLEAASFVIKSRTGASDKGQPRTIFSIKEEVVYFAALIKDFPDKRLLHLNNHNKTILKMWLVDDSDLSYALEKLYWKIEDKIDSVYGIYVQRLANKNKIIIVSDNKSLKNTLDSFSKEVSCALLDKKELSKIPSNELEVIMFSNGDKEVKGGRGDK